MLREPFETRFVTFFSGRLVRIKRNVDTNQNLISVRSFELGSFLLLQSVFQRDYIIEIYLYIRCCRYN